MGIRLSSLAACLLAAALSNAASAETTITVVPHAELTVFDPVTSSVGITQEHAYMIYDTLFGMDENDNPKPQMVEKYDVLDAGKIYRMTLRPGLKFHDGTTVTAKDATASIERWAKRDQLGVRLNSIGMRLAVVDDRTFEIKINEPSLIVLEGLARRLASGLFVMREVDAKTDPSVPVTSNIGSGPFKFVASEYVAGSKVVYEKNPDYIPRPEPANAFSGGKRVFVDRVEFLSIPDPVTAAAAVTTGSLDLYEAPPLDLVPLFSANSDVTMEPMSFGGYSAVFRPNFLHPPFNDVNVRKALLAGFDQKTFMSVASGGDDKNWKPCKSFLACVGDKPLTMGMEEFETANLQLAGEYLKKSSYKGEPVLLLQPTNNPLVAGFADVAIEQMRAIGLNVKPVPIDWASLLQRRTNKAAPDAGGWSGFVTWGDSRELNSPATNIFINTPCNGTGWFGWPCDDTLSAARTEWMKALTSEERAAAAIKIQTAAADFVPFIPLGQYFTQRIYSNKLTDLVKDTTITVFWNVKKN